MRSKVYLLKCRNIRTGQISKINRMKGNPKIVSEEITENDFYNALHHSKTKFCNFTKIRAKDHNLETVSIRRKALTGFDDKMFMLSCGIHQCKKKKFISFFLVINFFYFNYKKYLYSRSLWQCSHKKIWGDLQEV